MDQPANRDLSILIVDDMRNMRRTLKNMLLSLGYRKIEEAADGDDAIALIERYQNVPLRKFTLIILDWNMPRVHGIDVLRFIKKNPEHITTGVLMVTAENWASEIMEAAEDHVDGYIIKPFVAKVLEKKVNAVLERKYKPAPEERIMREGEKLFYEEEYDDAGIKFEEVLKLKPDSARAYRCLGKLSLIKGDVAKAEELFRKSIEHNEKYTKAYKNLADVMVKLDRPDEAIKILESAAEINPRNYPRLMMIGKLYLNKKKYGELLSLFNKANSAGLSMKHLDLDLMQAQAYLGINSVRRAVELIKTVIAGSDDKVKTKEEVNNIVSKAKLDDTVRKNLAAIVDEL